MPPSIEILEQRLVARGTETVETIAKRVGKAAEEIAHASQFDLTIVNENLESTFLEAEYAVNNFIAQ